MVTPTIPTVPLPAQTDNDTHEDDDIESSLFPQRPIATAAAIPPAPPNPPGPASGLPSPKPMAPSTNTASAPARTSSISATGPPTGLASNQPSALSSPAPSTDPRPNYNNGLSIGETAGIGVGIAIAVMLLAAGLWALVRQRRRSAHHQKHKPDDEGESSLSNDEDRARRCSELANTVAPQEVHGDQVYAAELQGSDVRGEKNEKENEEDVYHDIAHTVVQSEKKIGGRLFDDPPIDERDEPGDFRPCVVDRGG